MYSKHNIESDVKSTMETKELISLALWALSTHGMVTS